MHRQASVGTVLEEVDPQTKVRGLFLAQVIGASPEDHTIQVLFTNMSGANNNLTGSPMQVKVLERRGGLKGATLSLPQPGEWGVVCFPHGSDQMAVWLGAIHRDKTNLSWHGIGALTELEQHESGTYQLLDDVGNLDLVFSDGSYLRVGDGTLPASRLQHERQDADRRTVDFVNPSRAASTIYLRHASGTTVQIAPDGTLTITGASDIAVTTPGNVNVESAGNVNMAGGGPAMTNLGLPAAQDFIVLLAGLTDLILWLTTHTHDDVKAGIDTSGPPSSPPPPPVPGVDFTINTRAS